VASCLNIRSSLLLHEFNKLIVAQLVKKLHEQSSSCARRVQLTFRFSVFKVCCNILKIEAAYSPETLVAV
jgi:hypothetical protein